MLRLARLVPRPWCPLRHGVVPFALELRPAAPLLFRRSALAACGPGMRLSTISTQARNASARALSLRRWSAGSDSAGAGPHAAPDPVAHVLFTAVADGVGQRGSQPLTLAAGAGVWVNGSGVCPAPGGAAPGSRGLPRNACTCSSVTGSSPLAAMARRLARPMQRRPAVVRAECHELLARASTSTFRWGWAARSCRAVLRLRGRATARASRWCETLTPDPAG